MDIFSKNLKKYRQLSGYSLGDISRKTDIPKATLYRYENGTNQKIPIDVVPVLEKVLNLRPGTLLGWTSDNEEKELEDDVRFSLSPKEKMLVSAYRAHPEMQSAVDTLLGIQNNVAPQPAPQKLYEGRVAAFGAGPETIYYTEEDMENIRKAKEEYFAARPETENE